jgi:hypothetical protein
MRLEWPEAKLRPFFGFGRCNATQPISENELYLKLFITNGGGW